MCSLGLQRKRRITSHFDCCFFLLYLFIPLVKEKDRYGSDVCLENNNGKELYDWDKYQQWKYVGSVVLEDGSCFWSNQRIWSGFVVRGCWCRKSEGLRWRSHWSECVWVVFEWLFQEKTFTGEEICYCRRRRNICIRIFWVRKRLWEDRWMWGRGGDFYVRVSWVCWVEEKDGLA